MKVSHGYNAYAYQQQRTNSKNKEFEDAFVSTTAHRHGKHEHEKGDSKPIRHDIAELGSRMSSVHKFGGTPLKLTPEQLVPAKEDEPVFGTLEYYEGCTAEAIAVIPDPPTYPKSILDMSSSELRDAYRAVSVAVYGIKMEGVPKQQVYDQVKEIYNSYLGDDFLEISHRESRNYSNSDAGIYAGIYAQFFSELKSHNVHDLP